MDDRARVFEGLNPEQRRAVEAVEGPVCILAGAGSGKTTTITRRLANQVLSGAFAPDSLLAVTFTRKAAEEMRSRLAALGVAGVRAMTFHAAALGQLEQFMPGSASNILERKADILYPIARSLPVPFRFVPVMDIAKEIEWAKNQRVAPDRYRSALGEHEPPIPEEHMERIYRAYEDRKRRRSQVDWEDVLEMAVMMFETEPDVVRSFRSKIAAVTVDEYQDVNLLQQTLLDLWLGERRELCAVGDDYQAIYSFTGATPRYLLEMPLRFPDATVVTLERNYRSAPEIIDVANRLAVKLGGAKKTLRAERTGAGTALLKAFADQAAETRFVVQHIRELHADDNVPYDEMAILYRTNMRSETYELALSSADIPYQVRDGAFLERPAALALKRELGRSKSTAVGREVRRFAERSGFAQDSSQRMGPQEMTRQQDLAQLISFAEDFDDGTGSIQDFIASLHGRFGQENARGVNLLTLHSAKGLEFDAVFLPSLDKGELPYRRSADSALPEERRLLYVGMTRARNNLCVGWTARKPSPFVAEIQPRREATAPIREPARTVPDEEAGGLFTELKEWRLQRSRADGVPAFVVLHDSTLERIASTRPSDIHELSTVPGMGPVKCERYGDEIIALCARSQ
ncbi:MAG: ATP-dependent helicase [Actinomycetota bacterium]